jgi:trehalose 6-phosphate synthase/phosphatase
LLQKIINVSNRLPVTITEEIKKSSGGLVSALESVSQNLNLCWIGWAGSSFTPDEELHWSEELLKQYNYIPIFLDDNEIEQYYDGYANSCLWPTFHYIPNYLRRHRDWWDTYWQVNQKFADAVITAANAGDMVWIHDYHLMLVPAMIRKVRNDLKIGFFMHTPFPSYEVFRCIPERKELLEGVLGCDIIGFHTFGYMRHFSSSLLRILAIESEAGRLRYSNRDINTGVFPIGIDSDKFLAEIKAEHFSARLKALRETHGTKKIVLSVERLDYTKGIPSRIQAIEAFLEEAGEEQRDQTLFIFICVPSRGEVSQYQQLREEVEGLIGNVNGRFATLNNTPIHFLYNSVSFTDLCALYSLADVMLVTPYIDGMNLVAKEYVACRHNLDGVLILSEFAGAAEELFNSIIVNPYDVEQLKKSIHQALNMGIDEQRTRMKYLRERVLDYNATYWANNFLEELSSRKLGEDVSDDYPKLLDQALVHLKSSPHSALFLDYDGTLREFEQKPADAFPHDDLKKLLDVLELKFKDRLYVISGRSAEDLEAWMGHRNIHLIAEHGFSYKKAGGEFQPMHESPDFTWMPTIQGVLHHAVGMTPGSFIEQKKSSLVWHYRRSDPEFGQRKAKQLLSELMELASNYPVTVHHGKKIVEISSQQVNKGAALEELMKKDGIEHVLCAGDDTTDENMFRLDNPNIMGVKVGVGETWARHRVSNPSMIRQLLWDISDRI